MTKMAVIGAGMMGHAVTAGIIKNHVLDAGNIFTADVDPAKTEAMKKELGTVPAENNLAAVENADVILLSVKPQYLPDVMKELNGKIPLDSFILSIVAGVPMAKIEEGFDHDRVIRVMPNTPAQIGEGVSAWIASQAVTAPQIDLAEKILKSLGVVVSVSKESDLDSVTALSGSGPAYVFLMIEALIDAGVHLGLPRKTAETLAVQTVRGSADYMIQRGAHPAVLKNEVTSPGGTTAEALYWLEKDGFRTAVSDAVWACYERTVELGAGGRRTKGPENS